MCIHSKWAGEETSLLGPSQTPASSSRPCCCQTPAAQHAEPSLQPRKSAPGRRDWKEPPNPSHSPETSPPASVRGKAEFFPNATAWRAPVPLPSTAPPLMLLSLLPEDTTSASVPDTKIKAVGLSPEWLLSWQKPKYHCHCWVVTSELSLPSSELQSANDIEALGSAPFPFSPVILCMIKLILHGHKFQRSPSE